jgi:hypothetical protein
LFLENEGDDGTHFKRMAERLEAVILLILCSFGSSLKKANKMKVFEVYERNTYLSVLF